MPLGAPTMVETSALSADSSSEALRAVTTAKTLVVAGILGSPRREVERNPGPVGIEADLW